MATWSFPVETRRSGEEIITWDEYPPALLPAHKKKKKKRLPQKSVVRCCKRGFVQPVDEAHRQKQPAPVGPNSKLPRSLIAPSPSGAAALVTKRLGAPDRGVRNPPLRPEGDRTKWLGARSAPCVLRRLHRAAPPH